MTAWNELALARLRAPALEALAGVPGVWVVGGAVRDALLGRPPRELDLVVEGDAAAVAAVARRLGTPLAVHERFGTATVAGADVAAARRETYARPGALPDVTLGATLQEDLARRDFSVNALTVRLADGAGAAWPGALEDLQARRLRILHPGSFHDDPTRLLRLARYAARLDFAAEPGTAALAGEAVAAGALATVTGARIGAELRLALREPLPAVLLALAGHGIGAAALHPAYAPDAALAEAAHTAGRELGDADPALAALATTVLEAPRPELAAALDRLAFPAAERDALLAAAGGRELAARLRAARTPSAVAAAARGRAPEALAVAAALGAGAAVRRWSEELRHVRLAITGDDLLAQGLSGAAVGAGLRAAMAARLDGTAPDREAQIRAAIEGVP
jgi:tRNA nucleotidyltransferase (CCA-adding enzyme)